MTYGASEVIIAIKQSKLPDDYNKLLEELMSSDGLRFDAQECTYWDYKQTFPFSYSDDYFGGIVRLVCALHNTYGGLIIFGVHDKTRDPGHNKVRVDIERFNNRLRDILSDPVECIHRKYSISSDETGDFDVILVPKRPGNVPPVKSKIDIGSYERNVIWLRRGHEVVRADSGALSLLYGAREGYGQSHELATSTVPADLPPSPATIREFVGRVDVMDDLFRWFVDDDRPWIYLHGKGGSGKSTIAWEFAHLIAQEGRNILDRNDDFLDRVIFLSAKKQELDPKNGKIRPFTGKDFGSADELYRSILAMAEWCSFEDLENLSTKELQKEIRELLNVQSILVVIDDIDTLTTSRIDPGTEFIHVTAARAKCRTKLLYTLRNLPAQSLGSAIEVPGLSPAGEYQSFVSACCKQFAVEDPSSDFMMSTLSEKSERRPLVVESIIGLRRTAGSYGNAINLFDTKAGDDIRGYLFDREWNALPQDNRERHLLAALALLNTPATFGDLEAVLRFDKQQVNDAIGGVLEMFLVVDRDGEETTYALGETTRAYLLRAAEQLDLFPIIRERVSNYLKTFHPQNREILQMKAKVDVCLARKDVEGAWEVVDIANLPPKITEHPEYQMLRATVAAQQTPPKFAEAREAFEFCLHMKYPDISGMRVWFTMENASGFGHQEAERLCKSVINGKGYKKLEKLEFKARLGTIYFHRARNGQVTDPLDALKLFEQALESHVDAYSGLVSNPGTNVQRNFTYCRNTAYSFFSLAQKQVGVSAVFDWLDKLASTPCFADPLLEPLGDFFASLSRTRDRAELNKRRGLLQRYNGRLKKRSGMTFESSESLDILKSHIEDASRNIDYALRSLASSGT